MFGAREIDVIQAVLGKKIFNSQEIIKYLGITTRQLSYSLKKINQEISESNLKVILRDAQGNWKIDARTEEFLLSKVNYNSSIVSGTKTVLNAEYDEIADPKYRVVFECLFILGFNQKIGVKELQNYFKVSRNTILADLKQVNEVISKAKLELKYTASQGYFISGADEAIKAYIIEIVCQLLQKEVQLNFLTPLIKQSSDKAIRMISECESRLKLKYSDNSFLILYYALTIGMMYFEKYNFNLSETAANKLDHLFEYETVEKLVDDFNIPYRNFADIEWYCLLFLSSNTIQNTVSFHDRELLQAIEEMIQIFEQKSSIPIKQKSFLAKRLFAHLRPMVYRVRFNVPIDILEMKSIDTEKPEFQAILGVLKDSIYPIEKIIGKKIPPSEIMLISFYFGGELVKQSNEFSDTKKKAIVVCSNGLIVARMMLKTLKNLFPELNFLTVGSAREFKMFSSYYDVVFSSIPLKTDALEYVIPPILSESEKVKLRIKVLRDLMLDDINQQSIDIINIVKKYADNLENPLVYEEISAYLAKSKSVGVTNRLANEQNIQLTLSDFLQEKYITRGDKRLTEWREAVTLACQPLLDDSVITSAYLDKLVEQLSTPDSYYFLNGVIAIPHSVKEDGVLKDGCGLLILENPIVFPSGYKVRFIMPFALLSSDKHLYALNQLLTLSIDTERQQEILLAQSSHEVHEYIKQLKAD